MEYGLQMYSVRDCTEKDLLGAIRQVAKIGYKGLEFAGFFGHTAEEVKAVMEECGVKAWGTHTGADALTQDKLDATIAYHKAIGAKNLIIPGADLSTLEKLQAFKKIVDAAAPKVAQAGMCFGYHNHSHEFVPNKDGIIIYDWLLENTSLALEIDTYWAYHAGKDPVNMMKTLRTRLISIHIKDGMDNGDGKPLGQGTAPVDKVYAYAAAEGIPMVVESESLQPDGITEASECFKYLVSQEKK